MEEQQTEGLGWGEKHKQGVDRKRERQEWVF